MKLSSKLSLSVLTAALVLASGTTLAGNYKGEKNYKGEAMPCCPPPEVLLGGFYVGAQVGYDSYGFRERVTSGGDEPITLNPNVNATGFVGGLFLGYGQYFNRFYLGGEIFGNRSGASTSWSESVLDLSYSNKISSYGNWGLALLPGFKLNNASLMYLRLGYNWARFRSQETISDTSVRLSSASNATKWESGFTYGLGLETLICQNWSVRTEYTHTNYGSFKNAGFDTSYNPYDNQFMVGLVYHFA